MNMSDVIIPICRSDAILEGGNGVRFPVTAGGEDAVGFVVRHKGVVRGFLNRCAHVPMELDWTPGVFFESSGSYLMCATHGALYTPSTGKCAGGPCHGASLRAIKVFEADNQIFWRPDDYIRPAMA